MSHRNKKNLPWSDRYHWYRNENNIPRMSGSDINQTSQPKQPKNQDIVNAATMQTNVPPTFNCKNQFVVQQRPQSASNSSQEPPMVQNIQQTFTDVAPKRNQRYKGEHLPLEGKSKFSLWKEHVNHSTTHQSLQAAANRSQETNKLTSSTPSTDPPRRNGTKHLYSGQQRNYTNQPKLNKNQYNVNDPSNCANFSYQTGQSANNYWNPTRPSQGINVPPIYYYYEQSTPLNGEMPLQQAAQCNIPVYQQVQIYNHPMVQYHIYLSYEEPTFCQINNLYYNESPLAYCQNVEPTLHYYEKVAQSAKTQKPSAQNTSQPSRTDQQHEKENESKILTDHMFGELENSLIEMITSNTDQLDSTPKTVKNERVTSHHSGSQSEGEQVPSVLFPTFFWTEEQWEPIGKVQSQPESEHDLQPENAFQQPSFHPSPIYVDNLWSSFDYGSSKYYYPVEYGVHQPYPIHYYQYDYWNKDNAA